MDNPYPASPPDGSSADRSVEQNRRTNTRSLITVPLIGWTPKARAAACSFSVARYGPQQSTDPWRPDCANGLVDGDKTGLPMKAQVKIFDRIGMYATRIK